MGPGSDTIYTNYKKSQGSFSLAAERPGRYSYCFSNEMSSYARKVLRYVSNLFLILIVPRLSHVLICFEVILFLILIQSRPTPLRIR